jgi:ribonuclease P protein component
MRLPRERRLARSADFRRVREDGVSHRGKWLVLGVLRDSREPSFRVGFVTSRRVGGAVTRNLVRRRLRSVLSEVGDRILPGHLIVTVARPGSASVHRDVLGAEWQRLAAKAGLLRPKSG